MSLDDVANDGRFGAADDVHADVENLIGGPLGDDLSGDAASNRLDGGGGDDVLDPGSAGSDVLIGGPGFDAADYQSRTTGVTITLDDVANDGAPGETGNVGSDVEGVFGGSGNDTLSAAGAPGFVGLDGGPGNDHLIGGPGDDSLAGGLGADLIEGGPGEDLVFYDDHAAGVAVSLDDVPNDGSAGEGDDVATDVEDVEGGPGPDTLIGDAAGNFLDGGPGDDHVVGGGGSDYLAGESGNDTFDAYDGELDLVDCGDGSDAATIDVGLDLFDGCESASAPATPPVTSPPVSPAPPAPSPQPPVAPTPTPAATPLPAVPAVRLTKARVVHGALLVTVRCPATRWGACSGTLAGSTLGKHPIMLGHASFSVPAGKTRTIRVAVGRPGRAALARAPHGRVSLRATVHGHGRSRTVVSRLTL